MWYFSVQLPVISGRFQAVNRTPIPEYSYDLSTVTSYKCKQASLSSFWELFSERLFHLQALWKTYMDRYATCRFMVLYQYAYSRQPVKFLNFLMTQWAY